MNWTLFKNNCRQSLWSAIFAFTGIALFVVLFIWATQSMGPQLMEFLTSVSFLKRMLELAFGFSLEGEISSNTLYSIAWLHPVVLAMAWGTLIAAATRQTSGEMERGTSELVVSLPISRWEIFLSGWFCILLVSLVVSTAPLTGVVIGSKLFVPFEPIRVERFVIVAINFFLLNLAIGSLSLFLGVQIVRRGIAVAFSIAILIVFVAMNFLEALLPAIQRIKFISLLNYYRPAEIVRSQQWPTNEGLLLAAFSLVFTWMAGYVWQRRDMPSP